VADAILSMEITGGEKIALMLQGVESRAKDLRPVWEHISGDFRAASERQFSTEGSLSGGWAPLSSHYAAWKAMHYPGTKILELTGALRGSLTGGTGHIDNRQADSLRIGTSVPYGRYHQTGGRTPKRPPIAITDDMKKRWAKAMHTFIVGGNLDAVMERTSIFGG
jgi:phage gpG-like protein